MQKATPPLPGATVGFLLCFALFLLHLISLKYSLQLPPTPPPLPFPLPLTPLQRFVYGDRVFEPLQSL